MIHQSETSSQYVIQPPSVPDFIYKMSVIPYRELIAWANEEYQARLDYCAHHGYFRHHRVLTTNYSPKRILAEMSGYRRFCALMTERTWNELSRAERRFIADSFELRGLLLKDA